MGPTREAGSKGALLDKGSNLTCRLTFSPSDEHVDVAPPDCSSTCDSTYVQGMYRQVCPSLPTSHTRDLCCCCCASPFAAAL